MSLAVHVYSHHFGIYPWGVWTRAHTYSLIIAACKFFFTFNFHVWPRLQNYFNSEIFPDVRYTEV